MRWVLVDWLPHITVGDGITVSDDAMQEVEKISKALESTPDNEMLHYVLGIAYRTKGDKDKAEMCYGKALELKPDYFDANYELGTLHFNKGVEWNEKANSLPANEMNKAKDYDAKATEEFNKAIPYFEKARQLNDKDKSVLSALKKLYTRTGQTEKLQEINDKLKAK